MFLETVLNPVLNPLLPLGPFWVIIIVSLVVSLLTTIIYKYTTDQTALRSLKADLKRKQKKVSALKSEPDKAMKMQKEIMKLNGQYMKASFKSMLYTFLPILIFFGWLGANLAFAPLLPGVPFNVSAQFEDGVSGNATLLLPPELNSTVPLTQTINDSKITWSAISDSQGVYDLSIRHEPSGEEQFVTLQIASEQKYEQPEYFFKDSPVFSKIQIHYEKLYIFEGIFLLKDIPFIKNANWFWSYFLFSLLFSTVLRKALKLA